MASFLSITALVLGLIALILGFAAWMVQRKAVLTSTDLRNARNLQLATIIFLALSLISGLASTFYPTFGATYIARAQAALPTLQSPFTTTVPAAVTVPRV